MRVLNQNNYTLNVVTPNSNFVLKTEDEQVIIDDNTVTVRKYTTVEAASSLKRIKSRSLSLNGDIGMNFYIDLTDEEVNRGVSVEFSWTVNDKNKSSSVTLTAEDKTDDGYRSTLNLPAAEMTCDITVKVTIDGKTVEIKTFNIKDYTDTILTDEEFAVAYIA